MNITAERAYPTPLSNSTLLPLLLLSLARQKHTPDGDAKFKSEYDYIVVGAGSAGSVVASRLSEIPCISVLLLEAGKPPPLLTEVPALSTFFVNSDLNWHFKTTPQENAGLGLQNQKMPFPSGKALGGSSAFNGMLYVRGNKKNYDDWAAHGAKGWSYQEVLPYFKKMEDYRDPDYALNGYHGVGGPVTVERPTYHAEITKAVYEAAENLGYKFVDSNGKTQTGFYDYHTTMRDTQRCSTAKAYLVPAENRTNLDILAHAMVRKVIIRKERARGVQFDFHGHTYEVKARREVIISAGVINTPKLLMLSGIGPRKQLKRHKIETIADLPVGQNLQDQVGVTVDFVFDPHIPEEQKNVSTPENIVDYILSREGPLASIMNVATMAFLGSKTDDFPTYQITLYEGSASGKKYIGLKPEVYHKVYGPYENETLINCIVVNLQTKSRGSVSLQSKDPYAPPIVNPNYLSDPSDVDELVRGMKTCRKLAASEPLKRIGSRPVNTIYPGCEEYVEDEDLYLKCQARTATMAIYHAVGTAKMGRKEDPTVVVTPDLRVKWIRGLRVVDASVMPIVPSGNTNVPTIMVAEKASDIIKQDIKCRRNSFGRSRSVNPESPSKFWDSL